MSNYVYTITADRSDYSMFKKMLESLNKHCKFCLLLNTTETSKEIIDFSKNILGDNLRIKNIDKSKWSGKRMLYKIENILSYQFEKDDNVFILDDDLIIQDDIFKVFSNNFDVCITSRHYKYWYVINGGVWGFKYNEKSKEFLKYYISQIYNPTWFPLVMFRSKFARNKSFDWWVDQDFLCVVKENGVPINNCKVLDIGYKYNFCPSVEENIPQTYELAKSEILKVVGNQEYKILHFKGRLKNIIKEVDL